MTRGTGTPKDRDELINEWFVSVMGECVIWTPQVRRRYSKKSVVLVEKADEIVKIEDTQIHYVTSQTY